MLRRHYLKLGAKPLDVDPDFGDMLDGRAGQSPRSRKADAREIYRRGERRAIPSLSH